MIPEGLDDARMGSPPVPGKHRRQTERRRRFVRRPPRPAHEGTGVPAGPGTGVAAAEHGAEIPSPVGAEPPRGRLSRIWLGSIAALTAATVALIVLGVLFFLDKRDHDNADGRRNAVLAAARVTMTNFVNLSGTDTTTAKRDIDRLLTGVTGGVRQEFTNANAVSLLVQTKATQTGKVLAVGSRDIQGQTATVTVAARATITSPAAPKGQQADYQFLVTLQREGGKWLVSNVVFE
ncbi:MAG TPA: hypothetical protein VHC41_05590 [Mycobacteriales bacterium]|jgi:Mce-associated membrane protein|nr:hypothetical protein [Mycobacteriales bacterium]